MFVHDWKPRTLISALLFCIWFPVWDARIYIMIHSWWTWSRRKLTRGQQSCTDWRDGGFFSWFRHFQWSWGGIVGLRVQFPLRLVCSPNSSTCLAAVASSRPRARREREQCESVPLLPLVNSSLPCQAALSRRGSPPPHNRGPLKVKLVIILFTSATAGCQMERVAVKRRGWWIRFLLASHLLFANFFLRFAYLRRR